eukprot:TRINITY_DN774339_c0_g1_i1.p1 TRINITY_DN774339_c0_g1~~TRINITY_DN774339_c0_g1_i1.p1  ORF type:complete len:244 (+),score=51.70 TRINITY_DN774339_c0_g1_i1:48-779(+)
MSLRSGKIIKSGLNPLERKIPKNPRYAGVRSKISTGKSVKNVSYITTREYLKKRDEIYRRISSKQLKSLYDEYQVADEFIQPMESDYCGPKIATHEAEEMPEDNKPYLVVDVRQPEDFDNCNLIGSVNFPVNLLHSDRFTKEIFAFKNRADGLLVICDADERIAIGAAKQFVEKGFDNIFLLTGGVLNFGAAHPQYIEGDLNEIRPATAMSTSSRIGASSRMGTSRTGTRSMMGSMRTSSRRM